MKNKMLSTVINKTKGKIRRHILLFANIVSIPFLVCSCSHITHVETQRYVYLNKKERVLHFIVKGYIPSPITAEGFFPPWSDSLKVVMMDDVLIPTKGRKEFFAGTDFFSSFHEIERGSMIVDQDKKSVILNVEYTESYSYKTINGLFNILTDN